jgi:hypothetical protein
MQCKTKCVDVLHEWCGIEMQKNNMFGDILVLLHFILFFIGLYNNWVSYKLLKDSVLIVTFLVCIRAMMALSTLCKADTHPTLKPWSSRKNNDVWFMISGHTIKTMVLTLLILNSKFPSSMKIISVLLSFSVCFFQSATREHYSSDIFITTFLVLLAFASFVCVK